MKMVDARAKRKSTHVVGLMIHRVLQLPTCRR
jgi:hypothetical protein